MEVDFVQTSVLQAGEERSLLFSDIPEVAVVWTGATAAKFSIPDGFYLYHLAVSHTGQSLFPFKPLCNMKNE